ncbi:MAG: FtsX-like permease family protein [Lachnospiraceae bacterium]|nr:FtsX-like permease family protein [Lachnospiraceae bacterium]
MRSMMWRSTFREIKQSFGRFMAILAIVALGVSLFSGLKVVRSSMVKTTGDFWIEKVFYDYRILSTVGYDEQAVEAMSKMEGVRAVEGAVSFDILCSLQKGNEMVVKAHSLPETINQMVVKSGRLPEKENECVVDSLLFTEEQIGQKLVLSGSNKEEDLEKFAATEYTIVGVIQSPLYIQFERGNTSLGNGRISGFIYLPMEGFAVEDYTEVYVKFNEDFALYSQEYETYLKGQEAQWEELALTLAEERFQRVKTDGAKEIAEAKEELEKSRTEGEKELADAQKELLEASEELADGGKQLADGEKELADARRLLEEKEKEIKKGEDRLTREEQKLLDAEAEITKNLALWQEQKEKLTSGQAELAAGQAELTGQSSLITKQESVLAAAQTELSKKEQELNQQEMMLNAKEVEALAALALVTDEAQKKELEAGLEEIASYRTQIADGREQIADAWNQLADGSAALEEGKAAIAQYQEQMNAGSAELASGEAQLNAAYKKLLEAQIQLAKGKVELEKGKVQLADGRSQLQKGWTELSEGEKELHEARKELEEGRNQYEEGLKEYEDGLREFEEEIADAERKLADAEQELAELESPESFVLGRDTNIGYVCFENDSGIVDGIADVFPVFFFAIAALVCITTMNRMVEEQRTQIGVLKALGYSKASIMAKYLFYSGAAAAIGCILGFVIGTWLFPKVIWFGYGIMYQVNSLKYIFDGRLAVISLVVSMLCSIGAAWLSCRYELSTVAAQLMRPKAPKAGQRVLLERIPFIWKRLKFLHKVSCRNIFRYKKRFFMMIVGISGCTALLVTGFGIQDSVVDVSHHQYERIQVFDVGVQCAEVPDQEQRLMLEEVLSGKVSEYTTVLEASVDLVAEEGSKSVYMVAASDTVDISPYLGLYTEDGEVLSIPGPGECIVNQKLAEQYGVEIGDNITFRDEDMHTMELVVSGINVNYISDYVYLSVQTYEQQMGNEAPCKTLYVNLAEGVDAHKLSAALMGLSNVTSVTVNQDMMARLDNMLGSMDLIILVIILCAAGLAFIVLYNLTNINITERVREIATIKVLGFYKKETAAYVFRENLVLTFVGALTGLVLGKYFHEFVMDAVKVDMVSFDVRIKTVSYVYSLFLTIGFAWFVNWFMGKKLDKISMTESLKSVD